MSAVTEGAPTGTSAAPWTPRPCSRLLDRARFLDRVDRAIGRNDSLGRDLTLLALALDPFAVSPAAGAWEAREEVYAVTAARLIGCLHHTAVTARIADDEFVVLAEGRGGFVGGVELGTELLDTVRWPDPAFFEAGPLTASVGIARHEPHIAGELLLLHADIAMTVARSEGGDRCRVFEEWMRGTAVETAAS